MGKRKHIKIPLPKWKWWQVAVILVVVILAIQESENLIELLRIWLKVKLISLLN
jgi:hypothetical protein